MIYEVASSVGDNLTADPTRYIAKVHGSEQINGDVTSYPHTTTYYRVKDLAAVNSKLAVGQELENGVMLPRLTYAFLITGTISIKSLGRWKYGRKYEYYIIPVSYDDKTGVCDGTCYLSHCKNRWRSCSEQKQNRNPIRL